MPAIVGLRNPGREYAASRHNVGSEVVAAFGDRHSLRFRRGPLRVRADVADGRVDGRRVVLALPRTFMNESGRAVSALLRYYSIAPDELVVVHDDIDLPFAKLRFSFDRGSGGNRGVESVAGALGTQAFHRLRVGVGRPPGRQEPAEFVLRRFSAAERPEIDLLVVDAADVLDAYLREGPGAAVQIAGQRRPPE